METHAESWQGTLGQALQSTICARCLDGDGAGNCRLTHDASCAMKTHLPTIHEIVRSVQSHSIIPYEEELRKKVCGVCVHQSASGQCALRNDVDCALDRYFPLIVEVIEGLHKQGGLPVK